MTLDTIASYSANFGDASSLYSFIKNGLTNFPAKNLVVIENDGSD
ncbi:MAG: hypothetical protein ACK4SU_01600 [Dictyoglomus sp.]